MKTESQLYRYTTSLETASSASRKARTRSLIQLAGLAQKAGLVETFGIQLGLDLQKDPAMKNQVAALFKGFLLLNEMAKSDDVHLPLWTGQGLEALKALNEERLKNQE